MIIVSINFWVTMIFDRFKLVFHLHSILYNNKAVQRDDTTIIIQMGFREKKAKRIGIPNFFLDYL